MDNKNLAERVCLGLDSRGVGFGIVEELDECVVDDKSAGDAFAIICCLATGRVTEAGVRLARQDAELWRSLIADCRRAVYIDG